MKTFKTMFKTELKLSLRGLDMLIFAIFMPLLAIIIIGMIFGDRPAFDGAEHNFLAQSFGAVASIAICAGGVMGLPLIVSDYRSKKILKRFKVTPISPTLILVVQLSIYALYSFVSLILVYAVAKVFFDYRFLGSVLNFLGGYALVMVSMFSIGLMVGGIAPNIKIAGVLASLLYFPMLIFSGATLPYEVMPQGLQRFADVLPLTQGIKILKATSMGLPVDVLITPVIVMLLIAIVCIYVSIRYFRWE